MNLGSYPKRRWHIYVGKYGSSYKELADNFCSSPPPQSWKRAMLQRIIESGWFWLGVGIALFGLAMWVWG